MATTTTSSAIRTVPRPRRRMSAARRRDWRDGLLLTSPFIIGVLFLWVGPMLYSLFLLTQDWDLITPPKFIGLGNFVRLWNDPLVAKSLGNTAYYTFIGVPLQLIVAFGLALLLNQNVRGLPIYRTIYYLPSITPAVAFAVVWIQILNPEFGVLNNLLAIVGIQPIKWLFDPTWAKPAFILMSLWLVGFQMIIFLAGLQGVPKELHEAAAIDGANTWSRFWNVTLPIISPVLFFNLVIGIIGSFQIFTGSFIITKGGPQDSTLFVVLYIYRNAFEYFKMGYAVTLSWLLFLIIMIFTAIQFFFANRWVYYEGKV
ncbi:MAG: sugar ABC transporter permease [Chloroflexi bacterium]|nr:sugar ABC transporter permease [Chloroflexota bacterium]